MGRRPSVARTFVNPAWNMHYYLKDDVCYFCGHLKYIVIGDTPPGYDYIAERVAQGHIIEQPFEERYVEAFEHEIMKIERRKRWAADQAEYDASTTARSQASGSTC